MWNATCTSYPKVFTLSEARKNKIRIRVEEMGGIEKAMPIMQTIFKKMQESKFLKGESKRGWKASFDWVFENGKIGSKSGKGTTTKRKANFPQFRMDLRKETMTKTFSDYGATEIQQIL